MWKHTTVRLFSSVIWKHRSSYEVKASEYSAIYIFTELRCSFTRTSVLFHLVIYSLKKSVPYCFFYGTFMYNTKFFVSTVAYDAWLRLQSILQPLHMSSGDASRIPCDLCANHLDQSQVRVIRVHFVRTSVVYTTEVWVNFAEVRMFF